MGFAAVEALPLVMRLHSALQNSLTQVRLEHSKVEAHHSQLECSVPPQLAFAYSAHLVTRWAHLPRLMQNC
jgi:hypothetical protein